MKVLLRLVEAISLIIAATCLSLSSGGLAMAQATAGGYDYVQANVGSGVSGNTHLVAELTVDLGESSESGSATPSPGFFVSVAVGRRFNAGLALELEAVYLDNTYPSEGIVYSSGATAHASSESYAGLINLIYNAPPIYGFSPYAGVGGGYGQMTYNVGGYKESGGNGVWQLKAGVTYPLTTAWTLDLGYRYLVAPSLRVTNASLGETLKISSDFQVVSVGARLAF